MTGADIVTAARKFRGARWRHQGRRPDGVDCIGLVVLARAALNLETLDVTDYSRLASDESMLRYCREHLVEIARDDLRPGDLLVMAFDNQRHMGVVGDYPGGGLSLIHAYASSRKVVENRLDDYWLARLRGCFRMPEVSP